MLVAERLVYKTIGWSSPRLSARRCCLLHTKHESRPADARDERRFAFDIDLSANVAKMHVDNIRERHDVVPPNFSQERHARDDLIGMPHEIFENLELARQQRKHTIA